jgi:hypothetical protein
MGHERSPLRRPRHRRSAEARRPPLRLRSRLARPNRPAAAGDPRRLPRPGNQRPLCASRGDRPGDPHQHAPGSHGLHLAQGVHRHRGAAGAPARGVPLSSGPRRSGGPAQPGRATALGRRRRSRWRGDPRAARRRHHRHGGEGLRRCQRASAHRAGGQYCAHAGRAQGAECLDRRPRRARRADLRPARLQDELRPGAGSRGQGAARPGAAQVRHAGLHSDDGRGQFAERLGGRRNRPLRGSAAAPPGRRRSRD